MRFQWKHVVLALGLASATALMPLAASAQPRATNRREVPAGTRAAIRQDTRQIHRERREIRRDARQLRATRQRFGKGSPQARASRRNIRQDVRSLNRMRRNRIRDVRIYRRRVAGHRRN